MTSGLLAAGFATTAMLLAWPSHNTGGSVKREDYYGLVLAILFYIFYFTRRAD